MGHQTDFCSHLPWGDAPSRVMLDPEPAWEGTAGGQRWWHHVRPVAQPSSPWEPEDGKGRREEEMPNG